MDGLYGISVACLLYLTLFYRFKKENRFFIILFILFILLGFLRGWFCFYYLTEEQHIIFNKNITAFQGTITNVDQREAKSDLNTLSCDKITSNGASINVQGEILLFQGKYENSLRYGDVIKVYGTPQLPPLPSNPGEFNYRRHLNLNGQYLIFKLDRGTKVIKIFSGKGNWIQNNIFEPTRENIRETINTYLNKQASAIVNALILGERGNLEDGLLSDFQKTGVVHVLAISGLHVGFIALLLHFILMILRVPKTIIMALIVLFLVFFVALVNFKAPVVRASLMITFYYVSKVLMRPQNPLNTTALAAIVILLFHPAQLFLPGFQYSFAAVFGLIIGNSCFKNLMAFINKKRLWFSYINKYLRKPFIASLSAILATVPLTLYYFGCLQIGALVANIFVIPAIGVIVFLSILFLTFSLSSLLPAAGTAVVIENLINGMIAVISAFSDLPFIQINTGQPALWQLMFVGLGIGLIFNYKWKKARTGLLILISLFLIIHFLGMRSESDLKITFLSVGQGDAALIYFPGGKVALVDAGNNGFGFDAGERYVDPVLKNYGTNHINYLIGSHPHSDHIGGFEYIIDNYSVDTLVIADVEVESHLFRRILNKAQLKNVYIKRIHRGDMLNADKNVRMYILHPSDFFEKVNINSGQSINNSSIVIKMVHGKNSLLLMGDSEEEAEKDLLRYQDFLQSNILKVGHHGSKTSSYESFIDQVKPEMAIISVGENNKFNHPSISTLIKFANKNIPAYRTDLNGALILSSDGRKIKKISWR